MSTVKMRGFSILEVMVALLILGIGFVAVTKFQGTTVKNTSLTAQRAEAIDLAQRKVESFRHFAYDFTTTNMLNENFSDLPKTFTETEAGKTASYTITSSISRHPTLNNSLDISVIVTWPDTGRQGAVSDDSTIALSTILNTQAPVASIMSDSTPPPDLPSDPTVDLVLCTCSGSTSSGFSHMSTVRPLSEFFVKTGMMGHNWSTTQQTSICDSCCSLPSGSTGSFGGGMMGSGSNQYLCSVRQGQCGMRWQW